MKNSKKLIVIIAMIVLALLVSACALADERLYTSEPFKIPVSRVVRPEEPATEAEGESAEGEEGKEPTEAEEGEEPAESAEGEEGEQPEESAESEQPAEGEGNEQSEELNEGEQPTEEAEGEQSVEPTESEQSIEESGEPASEDEEEFGDEEEEPALDPNEVWPTEYRRVYITSSRDDVITEGETIYLESHLEGFGDLPVTYRWQVDKNDGEGWQDIPGADRDKHMFIATKETVQYNWRLIVDAVE